MRAGQAFARTFHSSFCGTNSSLAIALSAVSSRTTFGLEAMEF
jgi:hypothetical protein